jgi:hypothetical protein
MPLGLIARLRVYRRAAVAMAAGLIAVQALLAGLASAQAALAPTPDPAGVAGFAVICHGGNGGAGSDTGTDPAKRQHPCCESCAAGSPPATLPAHPVALRADHRPVVESPFPCALAIAIAPRAVRAGSSQAPPSLD